MKKLLPALFLLAAMIGPQSCYGEAGLDNGTLGAPSQGPLTCGGSGGTVGDTPQ